MNTVGETLSHQKGVPSARRTWKKEEGILNIGCLLSKGFMSRRGKKKSRTESCHWEETVVLTVRSKMGHMDSAFHSVYVLSLLRHDY